MIPERASVLRYIYIAFVVSRKSVLARAVIDSE
jgi:hypothetical protein